MSRIDKFHQVMKVLVYVIFVLLVANTYTFIIKPLFLPIDQSESGATNKAEMFIPGIFSYSFYWNEAGMSAKRVSFVGKEPVTSFIVDPGQSPNHIQIGLHQDDNQQYLGAISYPSQPVGGLGDIVRHWCEGSYRTDQGEGLTARFCSPAKEGVTVELVLDKAQPVTGVISHVYQKLGRTGDVSLVDTLFKDQGIDLPLFDTYRVVLMYQPIGNEAENIQTLYVFPSGPTSSLLAFAN